METGWVVETKNSDRFAVLGNQQRFGYTSRLISTHRHVRRGLVSFTLEFSKPRVKPDEPPEASRVVHVFMPDEMLDEQHAPDGPLGTKLGRLMDEFVWPRIEGTTDQEFDVHFDYEPVPAELA